MYTVYYPLTAIAGFPHSKKGKPPFDLCTISLNFQAKLELLGHKTEETP